jgi:hypothetical protein
VGVLEPLLRRAALAGPSSADKASSCREPATPAGRRLGGGEGVELAARHAEEAIAVDPGTGGHGHRDQDSGDRRVDARLEEQEPDGDAEHGVDGGRAHADPVGEQQQRQQHRRRRQVRPVELGGVEERDDEHGAEVVDDREGSQEHLERRRHPVAEQRLVPIAKAMSVAGTPSRAPPRRLSSR